MGVFDRLADIATDGLGDASGGGSTLPGTQPDTSVYNYDAKGAVVVRPYGRHVIAGTNVEKSFTEPGTGGAGGDFRYKNILGDGGRNGWNQAIKVWFGGNELTAAANATTTAAGFYRFHPGRYSTGVSDPVQGVDPWFPDGLAYNGRAYLAARNSDDFSAEDSPQKAIGIYECLKCEDWDAQGNNTATYTYSTNPALQITEELVLSYLRAGLTERQARNKVRTRINWPSWVRLRDYCAASITWDDGTTSNRSITRFQSHPAFAGEVREADMLDTICAFCGVTWQEDAGVISFLLPTDEDIVAVFDTSNMVTNSFEWTPLDGVVRPNTLIARFRDLDDEFLGFGFVKYSDTERVKKEKVRRPKETRNQQYDREFPAMHYSQAQRLLRRQYEIEANNPRLAVFRAFRPGVKILKGDFISVTHSDPGWTNQKCRVINSSLSLGVDLEVVLQVQAIDGPLYSDNWHGVAQSAL